MDTALPQFPALLPVLLTVLQFLRWCAQKNGDRWGDLALLLLNGQLAPSTKLGLYILVGSCFSNPYVALFTLNAEIQECFLVYINSHFREEFCLQGLYEWQLFTEHSCSFPRGLGVKGMRRMTTQLGYFSIKTYQGVMHLDLKRSDSLVTCRLGAVVWQCHQLFRVQIANSHGLVSPVWQPGGCGSPVSSGRFLGTPLTEPDVPTRQRGKSSTPKQKLENQFSTN